MRLPKIITLLSVLVFAASLMQKCFYVGAYNPKDPVWYLLLIGLIGVFDGLAEACLLAISASQRWRSGGLLQLVASWVARLPDLIRI